jgi:TonB-dependent SusC/RagA subfamily outer membrane receptor
MTSSFFSLRGNLPLAVLVVVAVGCVHPGKRSSTGTRDASRTPDVTAADIQRTPTESLQTVLAGRVSGVWVTQAPDGGIAVRIRGSSTVKGNPEPLYVIDDIPVQPGPGGSLTGINPHDIESIKVLKDAVSTAMYGSRGANGVILITTKQARS